MSGDAKIRLGIPLYPAFDSLDVLGPLQVFTCAPNISVSLIASTFDPVTSLEGVLPEQIRREWEVAETREAYKAWLASQAQAAR
jgi:hypothetical protein